MSGPVPESPIRITAASVKQAAMLSALAARAKAHWGYSAQFMVSCEAELSVSADRISSPDCAVMVATRASQAIGFYVIVPLGDGVWEFDALYVEPAWIGTGAGRLLFRHAVRLIGERGGKRIVIQSDPFAEGFYRAMGARRIGSSESGSIPGRLLPLLEIMPGDRDAEVRDG